MKLLLHYTLFYRPYRNVIPSEPDWSCVLGDSLVHQQWLKRTLKSFYRSCSVYLSLLIHLLMTSWILTFDWYNRYFLKYFQYLFSMFRRNKLNLVSFCIILRMNLNKNINFVKSPRTNSIACMGHRLQWEIIVQYYLGFIIGIVYIVSLQ